MVINDVGSIFYHIQIVHDDDNVVDMMAGGSETYKNAFTKNYIITDNEVKIDGGVDAHTEVYKEKGYSKFLEKVKKMLKAPPPPVIK